MDISGLKANAALAKQGVWQKDIPGLGDIAVFVRGTNTPDYRRRLQQLIRALPANKKKGGAVDPETMDQLNGICLFECSLKDWKNIQIDGKDVPFSKEMSEKFLTDPEFAEFRDGVYFAASTIQAEEAENEQAVEGKLCSALHYHLTQKASDDFLLEVAEEEDDAAALVAAVDIPEGAILSDEALGYWQAWHDLTSDRPMGALGGAGRIPWSAIDRYAERNGFEDVDLLVRMMWAMDGIYLPWLAEQQKANAGKS